MSKTTTKAPEDVKLSGLQLRAKFREKGMKRPMSWIESVNPGLSEDEKTMLRMYLLGRAAATMPEVLIRKANNAFQRLIAA